MKLKLPSQEIEASTPFATEAFDIGDKALIMDILRGKMYSNPIYTIAQEIMSNARDAHREVGKHDVPIVVTLPTPLDPAFKIRDFGPSITPDRMANVFIKYGNSTKRENDIETGGFGLGAKSPFSYTDMFTVVSITTENGQNILREYIAYIDESRIGAMSCVKEEITTEEQGTCIIVTAKAGDSHKFESAVRNIGRYWDVKPIVEPFGASFNWAMPEMRWSGCDDTGRTRWHITEKNHGPICLVDQIPYNFDAHSLFGFNDRNTTPEGKENHFAVLNAGFVCNLDIDEAVVTANREKLEMTDEVKLTIQNILERCVQEVHRLAKEEVATAPNLAVAVNKYKEATTKFPISQLTWHGIELSKFSHKLPNLYDYAKIVQYRAHEEGGGRVQKIQPGKYSYRHEYSRIPSDPRTLIVEDDTGMSTISTPRIASLLMETDQNGEPKYHTIFVVRFETVIETNSDGTQVERSKKDDAEKAFKWSCFDVTKLSTVPIFKRQIVRNGAAVYPIKIFNAKKGGKTWENTDLSLEDGEGIYLELEGGVAQYLGEPIYIDRLRELARHIKTPLYGVIKRYTKKLGKGWVNYKDHIQSIVTELENDPACENLGQVYDSVYNELTNVNTILRERANEFDPNGLLSRWMKASERVRASVEKCDELRRMAYLINVTPNIKKSPVSMSKFAEEARRLYPLLFAIRYYNNSEIDDDIVKYVNEKDSIEAARVRAASAIIPISSLIPLW